jgi:hypothetical protein
MARIKRHSVSAYLTIGVGAATWAAPTLAADVAYCTRYANDASASLVDSLNRESTKQFIHNRLYTSCLNAEAEPPLPRTIWALIDAVRPDTREVPTREVPIQPPRACPTTTVTKLIPVVKAPEQVLCAAHSMHTIYTGTSWRCSR